MTISRMPKLAAFVTRFAAVCINTSQSNCESRHIIAMNGEHSTRATNFQIVNNFELLIALNRGATQLIHSNSASALFSQ